MKPTNYIGYHVASISDHIDDTYDNSSENKEFIKICKNADWLDVQKGDEAEYYTAYVYENIYNYETNEMVTKILAYGTKEDMWNLERDLHKKYDVSKNPKYFNLIRSAGAYKTINIDGIVDLKKRIEKGEFTKSKEEGIEDLYHEVIMDRLQNRTSEDAKFANDIKKDIQLERNTNYCKPIRVKVNKDGKRKMFDGNTTLMAAYGARKKVKGGIKVDEIPYEISKNFTDEEFDELGVLLNKKSKVSKRPASKEDVASRIWNRFIKNGTPIKDKQNKKFIEEAGHRTTDIYKVINSWINKGGKVGTYINYRLQQYKPLLEKKILSFEQPKRHIICCGSGRFRDENVIKFLGENTNFGRSKPKNNELLIIIHHSNSVNESAWDLNVENKKKQIKYLSTLTGIEFLGFNVMDTHK